MPAIPSVEFTAKRKRFFTAGPGRPCNRLLAILPGSDRFDPMLMTRSIAPGWPAVPGPSPLPDPPSPAIGPITLASSPLLKA